MTFELKILGTGSASPAHNRHPSSQYLHFNNNFFLVDCGEGTQFQLLRYKIPHTKITHIFISHLHGDHYLGLIGLVSTMHLWGRQKDLYLYGPKGLLEVISIQLKYSETILNYKIIFKELDTEKSELIADLEDISIYTIPLKHRINCCGFLFREKTKRRRLIKIRLPENITLIQKRELKEGKDIIDENGNLIRNEELTVPPKESVSYAYCSDTAYFEEIIPIIKEVDLLYHEATFHTTHQERAHQTYHSTAESAAIIAKKANVKKLLIGHFSSRYKELQPILDEAKSIFENTELAEEGSWIRM